MTDVDGFHHVALTVTDLEASVEWYRRVLGFTEQFREEDGVRRACVMSFAGGGTSVGLVEHGGHDGFDPRITGLDHLAFSVPSTSALAEWAGRLGAAGVEHSGVIEVPPGAILNFKDPDGIALSLFWQR